MEDSCSWLFANEMLIQLLSSNGENVDSAEGRKLQERFSKELFAKLEQISPGVTDI